MGVSDSGMLEQRDRTEEGFGPAKPKIERSVLSSGLALKRLAWVLVETCGMGGNGG
jgi:hypothetical protein